MFRNAFAAALRHLARNRLYAAISVLGLALGLAAALLAVLVVRDQTGQDHFIPGHERIWLAMTSVTPPGRATVHMANANTFVGPQLQLKFGGIEAVTRLFADRLRLQRGEVAASERIYWADTNAFELLPLPVVAGELRTALSQPNTVVLPRSMARKYFGRDAPLGETLLLDDSEPLTVSAVIEDLPASTHLQAGIFVSTLSPRSQLQLADRNPANVPGSPVGFGTSTYLRLAPGASVEVLQQAMPAVVQELFSRPPEGWRITLRLLRMDQLNTDAALNPGMRGKLLMMLVVGFGILAIACINFINLLTARSMRRAPEVALRKLAGAPRGALVAQFLGESVLHVIAAMLLGVALVELAVPHANAFLETGIQFGYWREPGVLATLAGAALLLGVLAGGWPAFVMSAFKPLRVLKGGRMTGSGAGVSRQGLVTLQFAILIGLLIAAGVVWQQRIYATSDALRVDTEQMLLVRTPCRDAFVAGLRGLPGVRGAACSDSGILGGFSIMTMKSRDGIEQLVFRSQVDPGLFGLYGVKPLAGRLTGQSAGSWYVLNETAVRRLGYSDAASAIGMRLPSTGRADEPASANVEVIGVVPDFSLTSVQSQIEAMAYVVTSADAGFNLVSVRLDGQQVPETLAAIDALWKNTGTPDPISRTFLEEHIQNLYLSMLRAAQLFAAFAAVAVILACLGLFGLAASIAERRTREIGVRKALGAQTGDVMKLLLWQFARPVVCANLIAWPLAAWAMQRWLEGFAYHIDLPLWLFPASAGLALVIALATVVTHALGVARTRPIDSLRYE